MVLLDLALDQYEGPRFVAAVGATARPVCGSRGIVAECSLAMGILHAYLRTLLVGLRARALVGVRQVVDDLVIK
eukprot:11198752-Lingulodinium_polyedra.AAC.1